MTKIRMTLNTHDIITNIESFVLINKVDSEYLIFAVSELFQSFLVNISITVFNYSI